MTLTVLPLRDPQHVLAWRLVASVIVVYSIASAGSLFLRSPQPVGRGILIGLSLGILLLCAGALTLTVQRAANPHTFEGYLLLMFAALAGHALATLIHTVLTMRLQRAWRSAHDGI